MAAMIRQYGARLFMLAARLGFGIAVEPTGPSCLCHARRFGRLYRLARDIRSR